MKTCSHADSPHQTQNSRVNSWLYLLERFDVGVVHLDQNIQVMGMNDYARRSLPVQEKMPFGKIVTDFHPEAAKPKSSSCSARPSARSTTRHPWR